MPSNKRMKLAVGPAESTSARAAVREQFGCGGRRPHRSLCASPLGCSSTTFLVVRVRQPMLLLAIAIALALPAHVWAQESPSRECRELGVTAAMIDSVEARLAQQDSLFGSTEGARIEHCARVRYRSTRPIAVALEGTDERSGGLAIFSADGHELLFVDALPAARDLVPLGNRRLLVTYTKIRELLGAGMYESRYTVLCALEPFEWLPCLDLPKDRITRVMGGPTLPELHEHGQLAVAGSTLNYRREVTMAGDGLWARRSQHLGTVVYRLPELP